MRNQSAQREPSGSRWFVFETLRCMRERSCRYYRPMEILNQPMFWVLIGMVAFAVLTLLVALRMERDSEIEARNRRAEIAALVDQSV